LGHAAGGGGFLAAMVGPIQEDSATAGHAELRFVVRRLEDRRTGADGSATDAARGCSHGHRRSERQLGIGGVMPLRPAVDQGGAFGRTLTPQCWINVHAFSRRPRPTPGTSLSNTGARYPCFSARQLQPKPPPALKFQVRRAYVVQAPDPE
jgi:hypothetical protein